MRYSALAATVFGRRKHYNDVLILWVVNVFFRKLFRLYLGLKRPLF